MSHSDPNRRRVSKSSKNVHAKFFKIHFKYQQICMFKHSKTILKHLTFWKLHIYWKPKRPKPVVKLKPNFNGTVRIGFLTASSPSWCVWVFAWSHRLNSPELQLPAAISLPWNVRLAHALFKSLSFYTKKLSLTLLALSFTFSKGLL